MYSTEPPHHPNQYSRPSCPVIVVINSQIIDNCRLINEINDINRIYFFGSRNIVIGENKLANDI